MNSDSPTVSVILPVFNGEDFIDESINSILNQSFCDFELIIIDDHSTDSSLSKISKFNDKRIRLICNDKNLGLSYTLNKAISDSKGILVARMDQDDISSPDRFEKQIEAFNNDRDVILVGTQMSLWNGKRKLKTKKLPLDQFSIRFYGCFNSPFSHPSIMVKKQLLEIVNGYRDLPLVQDYDLWSRIIYNNKTANLSKSLLKYRIHSNKISSGKRVARQQKQSIKIGKENLRKIVPNWSTSKQKLVFEFVKVHNQNYLQNIDGWKAYKEFLKEFVRRYPKSFLEIKFLHFLFSFTIKVIIVKLIILPWKDKFKFIIRLFL